MALPMLFQLLLDLSYALRPIIIGKRHRSTGLRIGWDEKVVMKPPPDEKKKLEASCGPNRVARPIIGKLHISDILLIVRL